MRFKFKPVFFLFFLISKILLAQVDKQFAMQLEPTWGQETLGERYYSSSNRDSIKIDNLKFYISNIELYRDKQIVWKEQNSFHLIDAFLKSTCSITLNLPQSIQFNALKFNLGIDSITNVSGAMGGDLDPTKGMYWTWQSGYINLKLEGTSNLCASRKNEFQFHLGGYQSPNNALQSIQLPSANQDKMLVLFDLKKMLQAIDLKKMDHIMSPGKDAVMLSNTAIQAFSVKP